MALLATAVWGAVLYGVTLHTGELTIAPWLAVTAGLVTQLAFTAGEAAACAAAWSMSGAAVRWYALVPRLLAVSSIECLAMAITAAGERVPGPLAVWLAGARAAGARPVSGLGFAFGACGLLTLIRLLLSARAQAGVARASFARALGVVLVLYLATRLAMWWSFDLMQGRSFERWG
jgi:hypothetical protein